MKFLTLAAALSAAAFAAETEADMIQGFDGAQHLGQQQGFDAQSQGFGYSDQQFLGAHGAHIPQPHAPQPHAQQQQVQQPHAQQPHDPHAQQPHDPHAQQSYDPHAQQPLQQKEQPKKQEKEPVQTFDLPIYGGGRVAPKEDRQGKVPRDAGHVKKAAGRFFDWRDYEPNRYGGANPYADCEFPKNVKDGVTEHLDTPEYQALSAICKSEVVWRNICSDIQREDFFVGHEFTGLFNHDMNLSYDTVSDSMPVDRVKMTHPVGTHTKIEFIAHPDSPYTGVFRGAKEGILRISDTVKTVPHKEKTIPGHGVKFYRDGMASANILAMFSFDGQKSFNFFKNRWTTILREPNNECARETIGKNLATVTDHIGGTSVMEVAEFDQYGKPEPQPHWPFQIDFEPYDVYGWTDEYQNDFQDQVSVIPMNTVMFKVMAFDQPPERGGKDKLIGWIVSRSDTISSFWGDQKLFFQHRRMDDDIKVRPHYFDWLQFWRFGTITETPLVNPAPMQQCPFFFLFERANLV